MSGTEMTELLPYTQRADLNLCCHSSVLGAAAGGGGNGGGTGMSEEGRACRGCAPHPAAGTAPPLQPYPAACRGEFNILSPFLQKARSSPCGVDGGSWRRLNGVGLIRFFPENLEI